MHDEEVARLLGELHGLKIVLRSVLSQAAALCTEPNRAIAEIQDNATHTISDGQLVDVPTAYRGVFQAAAAQVIRQTTDLRSMLTVH